MTRFQLHRRILSGSLALSLVAACQPAPSATLRPASVEGPPASEVATASSATLGLRGAADIGGIPFGNAEVKVFLPGQSAPLATGKTGPDGQFSLALGNVISAGGGNVISAGGGNVISAGGGNVISAGGGNVISAGGGNLLSAGAPLKVVASKDGATLAAIGVAGVISAGGGNVISAGGGNVISAGGGNVISAGGGNVISAGGGNLRVLQVGRPLQLTPATTLAVVALGDRLEGALKAAVRPDGVAIEAVVGEVLRSFDQLSGSVGATLGAGGNDGLVAAVTKALDSSGKGTLAVAAQQQLGQLAPAFRGAFVAAADGLGKAISQAVQAGGTAPDTQAQAPITFAGIQTSAVQLPTSSTTTTTTTPTTTTTTSSGGSGGGSAPASGVSLGGNLNPASPATATTWTSPFGDLSSFMPAGNFADTALHGQGSVVLGNKVFLFGGSTDGTLSTSLARSVQFSLVNGVASAGPPVVLADAMLTSARFGHTADMLGGRVYVIGGLSGGVPVNKVDLLTVAALTGGGSNFAASTPLAAARTYHATALAGTDTSGRFYVIGGKAAAGPIGQIEVGTVSATGLSSVTASPYSLVTPRYGHAAVVTKTADGTPAFLYVFGGRDSSGNSLQSVEAAPLDASGALSGPFATAALSLYDPIRAESRGRHGLQALEVKGSLYLFGGIRQDAVGPRTIDGADRLAVDAATGAITSIKVHHPAFVTGRGHYRLALFNDSHVFVLGGWPGMAGSSSNPNVEQAFWR